MSDLSGVLRYREGEVRVCASFLIIYYKAKRQCLTSYVVLFTGVALTCVAFPALPSCFSGRNSTQYCRLYLDFVRMETNYGESFCKVCGRHNLERN